MDKPTTVTQLVSGLLSAALITSASSALANADISDIAFHPVPLADLSGFELTENTNDTIEVIGDTNTALNSSSLHTLANFQHSTENVQHSIAQYRDSINRIETQTNHYHNSIGEQAEVLGDLLLQNQNPAEAITAFEKSLHILRVNEGLYNENQARLLRKLAQSHIAASNMEQAHELQSSLFYLQKRLFEKGDSGYINAVIEWADWNVNLLVNEDSSRFSNAALNVANPGSLLVTAQQHYIEAIDAILASDNSAQSAQSEKLIHAEKKLAAINYLANNSLKNGPRRSASSFNNDQPFAQNNRREDKAEMAYFFNGSNALKRSIAYSLESPQPDYVYVAEQMMTLGDWYMVFDRRSAALSIYEDAYEVLDAVQASDKEISRVMTPGMPVQTPDADSFQAGDSAPQTAYQGYIDVAFKVSKFGIASNPEVIGTSNQDISPVTNALIRKIRKEKFRPAFIDGSATSNENVKLRYYYSYN